jgi:hypothetical protein
MQIFATSNILPCLSGDCCESLQAVFGAGLGAAFYILVRTYKYLADRSFDPKYTSAYLCRLATGILAGFILAQVSVVFSTEGTNWAKVGPSVIALLGGFSTEAVEQILQRMVEMLLALVKGDGTADAKKGFQDAILKAKAQATDDAAKKALDQLLTSYK